MLRSVNNNNNNNNSNKLDIYSAFQETQKCFTKRAHKIILINKKQRKEKKKKKKVEEIPRTADQPEQTFSFYS